MKLLIMSDTHGDVEVIERVKRYHPDAQTIIHCGDSELPYLHPALQGVERVKGNCDHDPKYSEEILLSVNDERVYVTHGHLFDVKTSPMKLSYRAREVDAKIVCFGHSHVLGAEYVDGILFINPGSLKKPRRIEEKSFVTLTITAENFIVHCYDDYNNSIHELIFER